MASLGYAWHVHHETLVEPLTEPLQNRIDYIKKDKPTAEQATRLRLIRPVKDEKRVSTALKAADDAWRGYDKALTDAVTANKAAPGGKRDTTAQAVAETSAVTAVKFATVLNALHREECEPDCPWNGKTIFPSRY